MAAGSPPDPGTVTNLLVAYRAGDERALERVLPLVYEDLRRAAEREAGRLLPLG